MNELETSETEAPQVTVNMYPSVKEQVTATALVSLVSVAIPVAAIALVAVGGQLIDKARTKLADRKARKEALWAPTETPEAE